MFLAREYNTSLAIFSLSTPTLNQLWSSSRCGNSCLAFTFIYFIQNIRMASNFVTESVYEECAFLFPYLGCLFCQRICPKYLQSILFVDFSGHLMNWEHQSWFLVFFKERNIEQGLGKLSIYFHWVHVKKAAWTVKSLDFWMQQDWTSSPKPPALPMEKGNSEVEKRILALKDRGRNGCRGFYPRT